jgi:type II secretory pathway pseudopilin PulG
MGARRDRRPKNEAGFTVIESVIALTLVFVVLLVLLGALTAGQRGLVNGRQRSVALAAANEVLEDARGRAYGDIGHDFDSDPTLATDPLISNGRYTAVNEPLVGSTVDAGAGGGTNTNPLYPFSPHSSVTYRDGTKYTTSVYVTQVTPATGDPYKRLSVIVGWSPSLTTAARQVSLSTLLYNAANPPDPRLIGQAQASAGTLTVCATLQDCSNPGSFQLNVKLPSVTGIVDSGFVKLAKGTADTGSVNLDVASGLINGCSVTGLSATCAGAKADVSADDDAGTAQPETDTDGPTSASGQSVSQLGVISATAGNGSATAVATGRSCNACHSGPAVGDNDMLPYFAGTATGWSGAAVSAPVAGLLTIGYLTAGSSCPTPPTPAGSATAPCGTAVDIDRDSTGGTANLTAVASAAFPSLSLVTFPAGSPAGYSGMVTISSGWATATASATSPTVTAADVTGSNFTVGMWGPGGYTNTTVTPGVSLPDVTRSATLSVLGTTVAQTATLHVGAKSNIANAVPDANGLKSSSTAASSWLSVDIHVTVSAVLVGTLADFWVHLDLGAVSAAASYQKYAVGS